MALQPTALSLLGVETPRRRQHESGNGGNEHAREARPARTSRRATSYYNSFQTNCTTATDDPPAYAVAAKQRTVQSRPLDGGKEILPRYTCTVASEAKVLLNIESVNPLHEPVPSEWRETYMVVRGTLLSFHKPKDNGPGRLLRSYTLQHAEVGLAPDVQHVTLEPRTRLAHVIPSSAKRRAWMKDPDLFEPMQQYAMRLRVETDQLVLASPCEERIFHLISAISAGIDVSCSIDERSMPRQCTVPRRRRRHRTHHSTNLEDPTLLAEQERILRHMYPAFAERTEDKSRPLLGRTTTAITAGTAAESTNEPLPAPAREEDEIDISAIREEEEEPQHSPQTPSAHRPVFLRSITDTSVNTTFTHEMLYATSPDNFSSDTGKWQPPHNRTPLQVQRYIKRCMPVLLADSARASDIIISNGKRVRVNLRMEMLEDWELRPPSYKGHGFAAAAPAIERPLSMSQNSASGVSATQGVEGEQTSASVLGMEGEDQITPVETGLANLELTKITSTDKGAARDSAVTRAKRHENRDSANDIHGVVFCF